MRLVGFYSDQNNIDGLLSTYKRLYAIDKDKEVAKKIIQIYTYKRDYIHLIDFLEESKSDDAVLLQLYSSARNYKKAYPLADKLYEETADVNYLGQSAIYEYESAKEKNSKVLLDRVVNKLEDVTKIDKSPIYLNYLGYILIDHKLDVRKGISYIQEVLKTDPDSAYYLDSLAWGYYRLGQCKKAKGIMDRVVTLEGGDNVEVLEHVDEIDRCIKINKGKRRR
jgi:lipopolysaccharide biosynthesis regulator YciM